MPVLRRTSIQGLVFALAICAGVRGARADDWLPISTDELKMTSEPLAPAASAIMLYRQVDRDDNSPSETIYERIKILTEEGRQYANVEIPFDKRSENIHGIQARTIRPDGSIVNFSGTIFDKPIIQARGVKLLAKAFTLPDIQVGSIVEYRYRHDFAYGYVFNSHWILSQDLFTKYAKYTLEPYRQFAMAFSWPGGLPGDTVPPKMERGKIHLETRNVPAFVTEEYMPPENELKYRVDFVYQADPDLKAEKDPEVYWKKYGKKAYSRIEKFVDERRAMTAAVAQIVVPGDTPEVKLHKIYERVQRLRNLSYERQKSTQEADRDKIKDNKDVDDVWSRGYGDGNELALLFLALVRAAGIQADAVIVSTRDTHFFNARMMNPAELNSDVVLVTMDGKQLFLDPGIALAPFGMLPWSETATIGLRLDKSGGSWITTPLPDAKESRIERSGRLKLTQAGALEGKVTVTYTGQQALWRRQEEMLEDDTDRKQFLENALKADIRSGAEVELTNHPDWDGSSTALIAEYDLQVPGWAAAAGQRALLPMGLFGGRDKKAFVHAQRTFPIYFIFPYETGDDITIELPDNLQVGTLPKPRAVDKTTLVFLETANGKNGSLNLHRELSVKLTLVKTKYFDVIQDFFQSVRSGDDEQVILTAVKKVAAR